MIMNNLVALAGLLEPRRSATELVDLHLRATLLVLRNSKSDHTL